MNPNWDWIRSPEIVLLTVAILAAVLRAAWWFRGHTEKRTVFSGLLLAITSAVSFMILAPWLSAVSREEALRKRPGVEIPADWEVVVFNHGNPSRWRLGTIGDHPFLFLGLLYFFVYSALQLRDILVRERRSQDS